MILPSLPQEVCDISQAVLILLRARQQVWKEFEDVNTNMDKQELWEAWNTVRRAMHHVQRTPEIETPPRKPAKPAGKAFRLQVRA